MKKPLSHQIDTLGQQIFHSAIPESWVCNPHIFDYGKYYLVETAEANELTGKNFYVQLKSKQSVKLIRRNKFISFRLEKDHAIYYADKVKQLPVFLILVDITTKHAWYIFLQPGTIEIQSLEK